MGFIRSIVSIPEVRALWTGSPLDLVGIGFALLILWTLVGGTFSMIYHQIRAITTAIRSRCPAPVRIATYTRSLIDGSCQELQQLQAVYAPSARIPLLQIICRRLEEDSRPLAVSLRQQFERRLAQERRLVSADRRRSRPRGRGNMIYMSDRSGEA